MTNATNTGSYDNTVFISCLTNLKIAGVGQKLLNNWFAPRMRQLSRELLLRALRSANQEFETDRFAAAQLPHSPLAPLGGNAVQIR